MSGLSKRLHQAIAAYLASGSAMPTPPASLYLALSAGDPKDDLSGLQEPSGGYARKQVSVVTGPGVAGGTRITVGVDTVFGPATGSDWPTVTHGAILDQDGNLVAFGPLGSSRRVPVDDTVSFAAGAIQFTVK